MNKITFARNVFAALVSVCALAANAQSVSSSQQESHSAASNQGVSTTFNSYGTPTSLITSTGTQNLHTNQSMSAAPAFSSPAVIGTCATAGTGVTLQLAGGGAAYSGPGGVDAGCDLQRDLNIMQSIGAGKDAATMRACQKPEIAKAMGKLCPGAEKVSAAAPAASVTAANTSDPYIAARLERTGK